jgi:C4-dicarboxylate-specific signal transduction histidine kinase
MVPPNLDEAREAVNCVLADADRAGDTIHRVNDHINKVPPKIDRFDVNEAIRNAIILTRDEVVRIGASIQTQLAEPPPFFRGDRVQIQQVMVNLIVNAIQATSGDRDSRTCALECEIPGRGGHRRASNASLSLFTRPRRKEWVWV